MILKNSPRFCLHSPKIPDETREDIVGAWNPTKIMNDRFFGKKIGLLNATPA